MAQVRSVTARKATPRYGLATEPGQPDLVQAAGLALVLLRAAKVGTWNELLCPDTGAVVIPYEVALSDRQLALLHEYQHLLPMVQRSNPAVTDETGTEISPATKLVTFAVCPECDRWILMSSGSAPARCTMTVNCSGAPVKASAATTTAVPEIEADYLPYQATEAPLADPPPDEPPAAPPPAYIPQDGPAESGDSPNEPGETPAEAGPADDLPQDLEDFD